MNQSYQGEENLVRVNGLPTMEAAAAYMKRGWSPTPFRNDVPLLLNWETVRLTPQNLALFHNADIGLGLGQISGGLYVVKIDAPGAIRLAPSYLSPTRAVSWRPGRLSRHYFYQTADTVYRNKYFDVDGVLLLELRADGQQILAAPSNYGEHGCILWEDEGPPAEIDAFRLVAAADRLATVTLLARHWNQAWRQELALALSGGLLRARWHVDDVATLIQTAAVEAGDEEVVKRVEAVYATHKKLDLDGPVTGWPTVAHIIGPSVVDKLRAWLGVGDKTAQEACPDPSVEPVIEYEWPPLDDCPKYIPMVSPRGAFMTWTRQCKRWRCRWCAEGRVRAILKGMRTLFDRQVWYGVFPNRPNMIVNLRQRRRRRGGAPSLWVGRDDGLYVFSLSDLSGNGLAKYTGNWLPPGVGLLFLQNIALKLPGPVGIRTSGGWSPLVREDEKGSSKWKAPVGPVPLKAAKYIEQYVREHLGVSEMSSQTPPEKIESVVKEAWDQYYLSR